MSYKSIVLKSSIIFFCTFLSFFLGTSQTAKVDSLLNVARTATTSEKQVTAYAAASWALIDMDLANAIVYNDSAYNISKRIKYQQGIIDANYKYVVLNRALGDYNLALNHLKEYEKYVEKDTLKLAKAAFQRGVLNSIQGDYSKSLKSYHKALEYYEVADDKHGLGITYNVIGIMYSNINRYDESIINFEKAIEILKSINDMDAMASAYTNLANVYDYQNEDEKALGYFEKSIELSEKTSNIRRIAQNKQNMGSIYKEQKAYSKAAQLSVEAYNTLSEHNYKGELVGAAADIAEIYMLMGDYTKSEQILKGQLGSSQGSVIDQAKLYYSLYTLYEATNRPKEALIYFKSHKKLSDSMINEKGLKDLNQLQVKFNIEKKDKELVEQKLTLEKQELELEKKHFQHKLMTGLALFLLLISILTWFLYQQRQKRKNQEILTLKREQQVKTLESLMEGEEKERVRIAKELHDGVNVDLSAIKYKLTSMLQQNNEVIAEAVAMIDKSCEQIRAISHNLVPPALNDFSVIEALQDYCDTTNNLHVDTQVTFQQIGQPFQVSKKAEVNIFRIVQELVNNCIKHAEASEIDVQISHHQKMIQITVEDNGKGFEKKQSEGNNGIGLQNVASRVEYLNATLDFHSDNEGTSYIIDINTDLIV